MDKNRILLIILIIALVAASFFSGLYLGQGKILLARRVILKPENSELIEKRYFQVTGIVNEISGRNLTLTAGGEIMKIAIGENALFKLFVLQGAKNASSWQLIDIDFNLLTVGSKVSVFTEEKENGELIGTEVYIHQSPTK